MSAIVAAADAAQLSEPGPGGVSRGDRLLRESGPDEQAGRIWAAGGVWATRFANGARWRDQPCLATARWTDGRDRRVLPGAPSYLEGTGRGDVEARSSDPELYFSRPSP